MITTTLVTGTLMFDGSRKVPQSAKIFVTLSDGNGTIKEEKQIEFDPDSLTVFKYLPFELRNFELPEITPARVSAFVMWDGEKKCQSKESVEIRTGLEEVILNMA